VSHNEKVKCRRMYERIKTRITHPATFDLFVMGHRSSSPFQFESHIPRPNRRQHPVTQAKVSDSGDGVTISRLNWVVLDGKLKRLEEGITTFPLVLALQLARPLRAMSIRHLIPKET
jgi:hypothetical protein